MIIRFVFSNPKKDTIAAKLIRYVTKAEFDHVAIEHTDERTGQWLMFEASHGEAHYITSENWEEINTRFYVIAFVIDDRQYERMIEKFNSFCQRRYPYMELVGIAIARAFNLRRNIFSRGRARMFCSEIGGVVARDILNIPIDVPLDLLDPKELKDILLTHKH